MNSKEALNLLSFMKLGIDLGFFPEECRQPIDELFMETQPAHLQKGSQQKLAAEERDALRAEIIRVESFPRRCRRRRLASEADALASQLVADRKSARIPKAMDYRASAAHTRQIRTKFSNPTANAPKPQ